MPRPIRSFGCASLSLLLAALAVGCQSGGPLKPPVEDIAPKLKQRHEEVTAEFDARRDEAQFLVAQTAWQQGNVNGCLDALGPLLKRNPKHVQGLALLKQLEEQGGVNPPSRVMAASHFVPQANGRDAISPKVRVNETQFENDVTSADSNPRTHDVEYVGGARGETSRRYVHEAIDALAGGDAKQAGEFYRAAISAEKDNVQRRRVGQRTSASEIG
jgi:hypothetical protein